MCNAQPVEAGEDPPSWSSADTHPMLEVLVQGRHSHADGLRAQGREKPPQFLTSGEPVMTSSIGILQLVHRGLQIGRLRTRVRIT